MNSMHIGFAHVIVFFLSHPLGNSKNCHPHVYGNFVWEFQVRYNNDNYGFESCRGLIMASQPTTEG